MSKIKWGIIGCGDVTEKKSGPAFAKVAGSELIAVMRRNAGKAADYAQRHEVSFWYDQAEKLFDNPEINSVYIATPPAFHLPYALEALSRNLNVYIEKPVTLDAAQAFKISEALSVSTARLSVAHYRRALPMFLKVKELLDSHSIGEVRAVQIRMWQTLAPSLVSQTEENWRLNPLISGGGYFHDLAPHQLDLMQFYFGVPIFAKGFSLNQSNASLADDHVSGIARYPNNVVLNGSWSFNVQQEEQVDECLIVGSKGSISFPFFGKSVVWQNEDSDDVQVLDFESPEHVEQAMIEKVVNYFSGRGLNPCSIDEACQVMRVMDSFTNKEI